VPVSGSFFTTFAAFALPFVLAPLVVVVAVPAVVVVLSCATAAPPPIATIARMLTPHNQAQPARDMSVPLDRFLR
jgi:hypothetical protein